MQPSIIIFHAFRDLQFIVASMYKKGRVYDYYSGKNGKHRVERYRIRKGTDEIQIQQNMSEWSDFPGRWAKKTDEAREILKDEASKKREALLAAEKQFNDTFGFGDNDG
jgi:hypothetical protein